MTLQIHRKLLTSCIHADTYQYFLPSEVIDLLWSRLENHYGQIQHNSFNVMWLETRTLLLKAPHAGNPLTVLRKRACKAADINRFHQLIEYKQHKDYGEHSS